MRSSADTRLWASGLVIGAALLGLAVVVRPGVAIPFTMEWILLFGITVWMVSSEKDPALQVWLRRLVFGALALRVLATLLVHFNPSFSPYFLAPDALTYEAFGRSIARYWQELGPAPGGVTEGVAPGIPLPERVLLLRASGVYTIARGPEYVRRRVDGAFDL